MRISQILTVVVLTLVVAGGAFLVGGLWGDLSSTEEAKRATTEGGGKPTEREAEETEQSTKTVYRTVYRTREVPSIPPPAEGSPQTQEPSQPSPLPSDKRVGGFVVEAGCVPVQTSYDTIYYSPNSPSSFFCVHPVGEPAEPDPGGGGGQIPSSCAVAPDMTIYCVPNLAGMDASSLEELYYSGELPEIGGNQ